MGRATVARSMSNHVFPHPNNPVMENGGAKNGDTT